MKATCRQLIFKSMGLPHWVSVSDTALNAKTQFTELCFVYVCYHSFYLLKHKIVHETNHCVGKFH